MRWCNKFGIHYLFNDVPISLLSILIPCIILYEHSCLHLLYCTLCIRSYIEDLSHGVPCKYMTCSQLFHGSKQPIRGCSAHLLIGGMVGLGYRDEIPMVSALVCMVTH